MEAAAQIRINTRLVWEWVRWRETVTNFSTSGAGELNTCEDKAGRQCVWLLTTNMFISLYK